MKLSTFQWTRTLLFFTVIILVTFGIGSLLRVFMTPGRAGLYIFYALAMFGDAAVLFICAWQLEGKTKLVFYLTAFVLAFNILVSIFDEVGWVDIIFIMLNLTTLVLLILARKEILGT